LVTGLSTDGNVIPIFGHFYIFHFETNNQIIARRVALIDVMSGRLAWAPREYAGHKRWNPGPDNDSDDIGILPEWDDVLRHTKVAHQACPNFAFVGWDAAFTEHGPVLLEGNANWSGSDYQRLSGEPLGSTKFAGVLSARLRGTKSLSENHPIGIVRGLQKGASI
jgi:hypothetical protein